MSWSTTSIATVYENACLAGRMNGGNAGMTSGFSSPPSAQLPKCVASWDGTSGRDHAVTAPVGFAEFAGVTEAPTVRG